MISEWKKKDNFSVSRHQELVDGINIQALVTATGELQIGNVGGRTVVDSRNALVEEVFFGKVTDEGPNGEPDFADGDPRYWVQRLMPCVSTLSEPITMEDDTNPQSEMTQDGGITVPSIVMGTNWVEISDANNFLQTDDLVTVMTIYCHVDGKLYKMYLIAPLRKRDVFPVRLSSDGGSNGTNTGAPTYTYTVKDITNTTTLGTTVSPDVARPYGAVTAATYGLAYYLSGTLHLLIAFEVPGSGGCA